MWLAAFVLAASLIYNHFVSDNIRPVTPTEDETKPETTSSQMALLLKDKVAITTNKISNKPSDHKIIVTGNADVLLTKLFESAEEKATVLKRSEGVGYKTPMPPTNAIRRGRLASKMRNILAKTKKQS